ncbi:trimeric intracellular cation channel family protein [Allobranchiibius sp. CTAmp26]|uniref:trimeric intracellular cation channel family protein n=1 Tax=Allobranchiibius sp. CTAmp26 TaxID=2815214 RepID=UPI001AA1900D|nr:TRIC cation channel family protein [Allobranchiibius sp. CTAmp26]MBO1755033.1 TRIC cation channel family protein [Allobranchiibius sp. CTAmp26]
MYGSGHLTELFRALDLTGVLANAVLGGVIARTEKLDPFGFATLAVLSGLGGGLIRDVLLQHGTPVALTDYAYLLTALVGAVITFVIRVEGRAWDKVWPVIDALALGTWAAAGAAKTLAAGLGWLPAVLLGMITAVGGGAVRDVVLRRIPGVLGGNTLYATCALAGAGLLVLLSENGHPTVGLVAATIFAAGLCLIARWRGWMLPNADAWSPARVVPPAYRQRIRQKIDPDARMWRRIRSDDSPRNSAPDSTSSDPARPEETP